MIIVASSRVTSTRPVHYPPYALCITRVCPFFFICTPLSNCLRETPPLRVRYAFKRLLHSALSASLLHHAKAAAAELGGMQPASRHLSLVFEPYLPFGLQGTFLVGKLYLWQQKLGNSTATRAEASSRLQCSACTVQNRLLFLKSCQIFLSLELDSSKLQVASRSTQLTSINGLIRSVINSLLGRLTCTASRASMVQVFPVGMARGFFCVGEGG